jgi:hypothetical protein
VSANLKPSQLPRPCGHAGTVLRATVNPDGTWIEPEAFAYPGNTYDRRVRAVCDDGKLRVLRCCCPDTAFSVPAKGRVNGRYVRGFVSMDGQSLRFHEYKGVKC